MRLEIISYQNLDQSILCHFHDTDINIFYRKTHHNLENGHITFHHLLVYFASLSISTRWLQRLSVTPMGSQVWSLGQVDPLKENGNPLQTCSCWRIHEQRPPVSYSPQNSQKEWTDTTSLTHLPTYLLTSSFSTFVDHHRSVRYCRVNRWKSQALDTWTTWPRLCRE